ncbi:MAG: cellulase family glycosylhydrolase, partial [Anaerolineales bacterium]
MNSRPNPTQRTTLIVSLFLIVLITTISVSAAPQAEPEGMPALEVPERELAAPLAQLVLEENSPSETLGVQATSPGMFLNGGATLSTAGANFVRLLISWEGLAPTDIDPEDYDWTALDNAMDLAVSEGYEVVAELDHNPDWAASWERGPVNCVPLSRFTDFVDAVVTRYSAAPYNVKYWEVYNEPDSA